MSPGECNMSVSLKIHHSMYPVVASDQDILRQWGWIPVWTRH